MTGAVTTVNDRKEIFGWAMYDWANSAFSTTVGTVFLAPYVASLARAAAEAAGTSTIPFLGIPVAPDSFLPYCISFSVGMQVLFLPILGAIADYSHRRKQMMQLFATIGAICIPARALSELARVAADGNEVISMIMPKGRSQVVFHMKEIELVSQLIDGTFPDYQQIIPRSYKSRTILSTPALLKACKQAEIFAREGSNVARFNIKSAGDTGTRRGGDLRHLRRNRFERDRGGGHHRWGGPADRL